jgi:hypothetical protein
MFLSLKSIPQFLFDETVSGTSGINHSVEDSQEYYICRINFPLFIVLVYCLPAEERYNSNSTNEIITFDSGEVMMLYWCELV